MSLFVAVAVHLRLCSWFLDLDRGGDPWRHGCYSYNGSAVS